MLHICLKFYRTQINPFPQRFLSYFAAIVQHPPAHLHFHPHDVWSFWFYNCFECLLLVPVTVVVQSFLFGFFTLDIPSGVCRSILSHSSSRTVCHSCLCRIACISIVEHHQCREAIFLKCTASLLNITGSLSVDVVNGRFTQTRRSPRQPGDASTSRQLGWKTHLEEY